MTRADHNYDHGSLSVDTAGGRTRLRVVGTFRPGPQAYATGGEVSVWTSDDNAKTWSERRLTRGSVFNHTHPRVPLNHHPGFFAFWADGHALEPSASSLYFATESGAVYRMPEAFPAGDADVEPVRVPY